MPACTVPVSVNHHEDIAELLDLILAELAIGGGFNRSRRKKFRLEMPRDCSVSGYV